MSEKIPKEVLYRGREEPAPEQRPLRAGPLAMVFVEGELRWIRLGEREVVRRIYAAVRDRDWRAVPARISDIAIESGPDSFRVRFQAEHREREIDFAWTGEITGDPSGNILFSMAGSARATFHRNRIGLCVHHPLRECAGMSCRVEQEGGAVIEGTFPLVIAPSAPFREIISISHEAAPGVQAQIRFSGDIFEMEDQRNWGDASFKTFSTPLRLPFPVEVKSGTRISQSVALTLSGKPAAPAAAARPREPTIEAAGDPAGMLPRIGLGTASHRRRLSPRELERLQALHLSHLRVDLDLADPDCAVRLGQAWAEAAAIGAALEPALFLSGNAEAEMTALRELVKRIRPKVIHWLMFHKEEGSTRAPWIRLARERLRGSFPSVRIGAGTDGDFFELNRERPPAELLKLVCYSFCPQVHAGDDATLIENLEAHTWTLESARQLAGVKPIAVTPVTLRPRSGGGAAWPKAEPPPGELPPRVDARQMSLLGAGWTVGSLKYFSESEASCLTYYETTGWRGVMETEEGSPLPEEFRSIPGAVFPLYHVLADVGDFAGGRVIPCRSSDPFRIEGLAIEKDGRRRLLVANLTPEPREAALTVPPGRLLIKHLDETNAESAMKSPGAFRAAAGSAREAATGKLKLHLLPYAVARIDSA